MNKEQININRHTHVWAVQHGNPTNPDGVIYVDCVGKATAKLTASQMGLHRVFIATPIERIELPSDTTIVKGIIL